MLSSVSNLEKHRVIHLARTPQVLQLPVLLLSMQLFFGVLKVLPLRHLRVLIHPPCWSPAPLSTHGLHNTSQLLWPFEPSTNGSKSFPSQNQRERFSMTTSPRWRNGGQSSRLTPWTLSNVVAATMSINVNLMGKNYEALNLLRTMTAGISLTN